MLIEIELRKKMYVESYSQNHNVSKRLEKFFKKNNTGDYFWFFLKKIL